LNSAILNIDHIEIEFPYDVNTINIVRSIQGREWDKPNRVWKLPATKWHFKQVVDKLQPIGFYIDPEIVKLADDTDEPEGLTIPSKLYDFQQEGVKFIAKTGGRCIIADDMGLGKTIEALTYISLFPGRVLIVCPANVLYKWGEIEIPRWLPTAKCQIIETNKTKLNSRIKVHVMSYSIMVGKFEDVQMMPYDIIIFDEAHYIKNPKAQRTRIAKALVQGGIQRVLFLSGTPFMNHPTELFPMLNMLDPVGFNNSFTFAMRYAGAQKVEGGWYFPPGATSNLDELADRLKDVMIRRTKGEVLAELPDLTRSLIPVEIENRTAYRDALKDIRDWLKDKERTVVNHQHVLTRLNVLRQIVGEGKVEAAIELAEDILQTDRKVVLFAHHKDVVERLYEGLKEYGCATIVGETSAKQRQENSKQFLISDSKIRAIIISTAGAEGIDLYGASDIIFVERDWTPAREEQAEARLHRIGQKSAVTAHYLVALKTIDEKLAKIVDNKRKIIGQVISQDEIVSNILKEL
jgi:SWI/SNF-related matrix-associated actin-dependent regulator of chromatin subfamily A-like protein 1